MANFVLIAHPLKPVPLPSFSLILKPRVRVKEAIVCEARMSNKRQLIAIVDDDEAVCRALKRVIVADDMNAATFCSGGAFLDFLATEWPDCVVLDFHMPVMTGEDVLRALAQNGRRLPVIIITGRDDPGNKASAMMLGARAYLLKPLIPAELRAAIFEAIAA